MFQAMEIHSREKAEARLTGNLEGPPITALISISDPAKGPPAGVEEFAGPKLVLEFTDVEEEGEWLWEGRPTKEHVQQIIQFAEDNRGTENILIHCNAGESRSTATGLVVQCVWWEPGKEDLAVGCLASAMRGTVCNPNMLITQLADDLLQRDNRMVRQVEWIKIGLKGMYS